MSKNVDKIEVEILNEEFIIKLMMNLYLDKTINLTELIKLLNEIEAELITEIADFTAN